jgi:hypothetical protein
MAVAQNTVIIDDVEYKPGEQLPELGSIHRVFKDGGKRHYEGLAKDSDKLPLYVANNSSCFMTDTGEYYKFDESKKLWYKPDKIEQSKVTPIEVYGVLNGKIKQVSEDVEGIATPLLYKGSVSDISQLPLSPKIGWMYNISEKSIYGEAGMNVAWTGEIWDTLGPAIDMAPYLREDSEIITSLKTKTENLESANYTDRGTLADTDAFLINDGTGMKKSVLSKLSDFVLNKIADKVFAKLQTNDKTILGAINELNSKSYHNIPRLVPKDITAYYKDGSLWKRLEGTGDYSLYQDIYVGDYFQMSRVISAKNPDSTQQTNGTDWVTIASIGGLAHNGDNIDLTPNHLVMVPGKGFGGTQHFGKSRMNPTSTTDGGYKASEMNTKVLGAIATAGSTAADATINQQLYAEFGTHLKKTRELITNKINATGIDRYGSNNGCSSGWEWTDVQAILMSEVELYGSTVWSSSGWDTGSANHQFELFANSKSAINNRSAWYWMKDVASASEFCTCGGDGRSGHNDASSASSYVRLRFVIAA